MLPESLQSFSPDYAAHPGQTLSELIEHLGLTQADLAERANRPKKTINEIVKGKAAITPETSIQLERVLGIPAAFWNSLEQNYRSAVARLEERKKLEGQLSFLDEFPVDELIKREWIKTSTDPVTRLENLLQFFGVASPEAWNEVWGNVRRSTSFRQSTARKAHFGAGAAWLRQGEIDGRAIQRTPSYNAALFKDALTRIRRSTSQDPQEACPSMQRECAAAGVIVVLVRELPRAATCGAARWLSPDRALLQLSLLYKKDDQFWFSFFHEAAHILLHSKRELFVDATGGKGMETELEEEEANDFAANFLIPPPSYKAFVEGGDFSSSSIKGFAKELGIASGIVVGRLQHDKFIKFSERNELRRRFDWA